MTTAYLKRLGGYGYDVVMFTEYVDPDPPSDVRKYHYIPLPEAGFTQSEADEIAKSLNWVADGIAMFAKGDETNIPVYIWWLADIIAHWNTTITDNDGIVIVESD